MVRGRPHAPRVGIFQEGTHDVVDIPRCVVHHPVVNEAAQALRAALRATLTPPYVDETHAGLVRALQVVVERSSQRCQLVVVANTERPEPLSLLFGLLEASLGQRLHSLWFNGHTARSNAVLGSRWEHIVGAESVVDEVGGARIFFPPAAFGQANPALMDEAVREVHGWVPSDSRVLELYAGVGTIGLGLAKRGNAVTFNEVGAGSLAGLALGLREAGLSHGPRVRVAPGPAEQAISLAGEADVVIVDPPRKGLGDEVVRGLLGAAPERLIYLSCGLDSFLRDARALSAGFSLRTVRAFGFFPYTEHVETLALFERSQR